MPAVSVSDDELTALALAADPDVAVVASFLLITAAGPCNTYGQLHLG